jgi:sorbitol-specific phosphotransferase system component IIC
VQFSLEPQDKQKPERYRIMEYACHPMQLLYEYIHGNVIPLYYVIVYQGISTPILNGICYSLTSVYGFSRPISRSFDFESDESESI